VFLAGKFDFVGLLSPLMEARYIARGTHPANTSVIRGLDCKGDTMKGDSESGKGFPATFADLERDFLLLRAGYAVCHADAALPPGVRAIYSGGGVHVGPSHQDKKGRMTLRFSFSHGSAGADTCKVFHALQDVLGGGEVTFDKDGNEPWDGKANMVCPSKKCERK
jgi:hypothetical protein